MKKEIRKQIRAAIRLFQAEEWNAIDGIVVEYLHARPMAWIRGTNRRPIIAAAKHTVKAFAKNADGSFRRCAVYRCAARRNLAEVIFRKVYE